MTALGELGEKQVRTEERRGLQQPAGQHELMSCGQTWRRRSALFLKNLSVGVLWFPFCLTFGSSGPSCELGSGARARAAPSDGEHEQSRHLWAHTPLREALPGTALLLPQAALRRGDRAVSICEKSLVPPCGWRKTGFSFLLLLSLGLSVWFGIGSWSSEYLFSVMEYSLETNFGSSVLVLTNLSVSRDWLTSGSWELQEK